jgi:hypothetical protein
MDMCINHIAEQCSGYGTTLTVTICFRSDKPRTSKIMKHPKCSPAQVILHYVQIASDRCP